MPVRLIDKLARMAATVAIAAVLSLLTWPTATIANDKNGEKPDYKPFAEVVEGYDLIDGFFPLYYNKKTDNLLAVIPSAMVGPDFLIADSVVAGGRLTGYQFGHSLVHWEELNKKLLLVQPESRHFRNDSTMKDVIDRTYSDSVLLSTAIVTKRGKDPVIDLDQVFKHDRSGLSGYFGGAVDPSLSRWAETKCFPDNVELSVEAVYKTKKGYGKRATVHYSISKLPKTDYKPREADDRIGYFLTARKDWGSDYESKTLFKRYIHRWHLRKSDPSEDISDVHPDDQIVFYIEKTVPVKYRRYIREGILLWNKAFEKAGLRNVMQVRQQTDTNEFANLDPEDVRYNFFRWIVTGDSFAMGPSRANPLTGQIFDADIVMDDSLVRAWHARYDQMIGKGPNTPEDPSLKTFLDKHPEWDYRSMEDRLMPLACQGCQELHDWEPDIMKSLQDKFPQGTLCSFANQMTHEMALGAAICNVAVPELERDDFVGQWIKLIACHEVGHTLGLRHNFKASAWKSLDEILANEDPNVPTVASVMDYTPAVYNLDRSQRKVYINQMVGPYDELAIAYGYGIPKNGEKEADMLTKICGQISESGLDYATDQDRSFIAPDPLVNVYDHGDDPVAWARYRMGLMEELRKDMVNWAVESGESYDQLRRSLEMILFEYSRVIQYAARVVGGQYFHRDHKGDPNERPAVEIVPVERQRAALDFLASKVFSGESFDFPPELLNRLAPGRWHHWDSESSDSVQEFPIHDRVAAIQYWALFHLTNPFTIARVHDAELKVPNDQDAFTVGELLGKTTKAIWSEAEQQSVPIESTDRRPLISSVRRNLQRKHLQLLTRIVLSQPGNLVPADAVSIARMVMSELHEKLQAMASNEKIDDASRAHLVDSAARIGKALEAGYDL